MISPAVIAIIAAVLVTLGFGGGFAVADWRAGANVGRLTSSNTVLSAANDKCATDIRAVKTAITDIQNKTDERQKAASISMVVATRTADTHTAKAKQIKSLPPAPVDMQCEAVKMEQLEYVRSRARP